MRESFSVSRSPARVSNQLCEAIGSFPDASSRFSRAAFVGENCERGKFYWREVSFCFHSFVESLITAICIIMNVGEGEGSAANDN